MCRISHIILKIIFSLVKLKQVLSFESSSCKYGQECVQESHQTFARKKRKWCCILQLFGKIASGRSWLFELSFAILKQLSLTHSVQLIFCFFPSSFTISVNLIFDLSELNEKQVYFLSYRQCFNNNTLIENPCCIYYNVRHMRDLKRTTHWVVIKFWIMAWV